MQALTNPDVEEAIETQHPLPHDWNERSTGGRIDWMMNHLTSDDILTIYRTAFNLDGVSENQSFLSKTEKCRILGVLMQDGGSE